MKEKPKAGREFGEAGRLTQPSDQDGDEVLGFYLLPELSETPFYVLIGQAAGCLCTETYKP